MEKEVVLLRRLVNLAHAINNEYYNLIYYESNNMKGSKDFKYAIKGIEEYTLVEIDAYQEIDYDTVIGLLRIIPDDKLDEDNDYIRVYRTLSRRFLELSYEMRDKGIDVNIHDEINHFEETMEWDIDSGFKDYLEDYQVDEYRHQEEALALIYVKAIKKAIYSLENTIPDNKDEAKLAQQLINNFNEDKYSFFTRDNSIFEMLGILYEFDPKMIPDYERKGDYQNIYYNECLFIIRDIYNMTQEEDENINTLLFLSLCFEEMIGMLGSDRVNNISKFIQGLDDNFKESFYITNISDKVKARKREL